MAQVASSGTYSAKDIIVYIFSAICATCGTYATSCAAKYIIVYILKCGNMRHSGTSGKYSAEDIIVYL